MDVNRLSYRTPAYLHFANEWPGSAKQRNSLSRNKHLQAGSSFLTPYVHSIRANCKLQTVKLNKLRSRLVDLQLGHHGGGLTAVSDTHSSTRLATIPFGPGNPPRYSLKAPMEYHQLLELLTLEPSSKALFPL